MNDNKYNDKVVPGKNNFKIVMYGLLSVLLYLSYRSIFRSQFWMLDDHVLINAHDKTVSLPVLRRFTETLRLSSVDYFPEDGRLNPSLMVFYALRVFFFGKNQELYFGLNFVILVFTSIAFYKLLTSIRLSSSQTKPSNLELLAINIFSFGLFAFPTFILNFTTLGTSELIGPLLLFLVLDLTIRRILLGERSNSNLIQLILFTFLLAGVKENYAISLLFIQLVFLFLSWKLRKIETKLTIISLSISLLHVLQIIRITQSNGTDVYGKETGFTAVLWSFSEILTSRHGVIVLILYSLTIILSYLSKESIYRFPRSLISLPLLIFFADWIVYRGDIRDRYATNAYISVFLAIYILLAMMWNEKKRIYVKGVLLILLPGILLVELPDGRNAVENKVIATERFMAGLKEIQKWSLEGESLPVAFVAQSDWDYESIISVATYFHSAGLKNSLILEVSSEFPANSTSISTFRVWSTEGVAGLYAPKNETSKDYVACIYSENIPKKKLEGCRDEIILKWLP